MKVLDTQNTILHANPAFEQLLARDLNELRHSVERDLIHPVDLYRFRQRFQSMVLHETEFSEFEARHHHADGHWIPTLLNHMRLASPDKSNEYILEIVVDLSHQHDRSEAPGYYESRELLGQMARGVAHDFNNLLTVVMAKLALLTEATASDDAVETVAHETQEVLEHMHNLSQSLARFGQGQPDQAEPIDVNDAIAELSEYFAYISPRSIALEYELGNEVPKINASRVQLEQILLNLVVNASDAIAEKKKSGIIKLATCAIWVEADQDNLDLDPGRYVVISVHDDGIGMNEETRKQLFEPYFSTKGDAGTGIGLSTVYAIVEQGRGYIGVDSHPGGGTRLDIYLPAVSQNEPAV